METIKIGLIEFNAKSCKNMSKRKFYKTHKVICEKFNVDIDFAYSKLSEKKSSPKD